MCLAKIENFFVVTFLLSKADMFVQLNKTLLML